MWDKIKPKSGNATCWQKIILRFFNFQEKTPSGCESNKNSYFIENTEEEESPSKEDAEPRPALAPIFEEELTLSYTANIARRNFFSAIHSMEKNIKKGNHISFAPIVDIWLVTLQLL